ncbi:MAG: tetratricopeptide repeat protein [Spirochaetales bacterium]|nr:tetratricopeptide repeat protein [Spirochaetales bacterium]
MSQSHDKSEKITLKGKLSLLIQKYSYILLGSIIAIVFLVIGLLIYNSLQMKNLEKDTQQIESIQDDFENLGSFTDDEKLDSARKEIEEKLNILIDDGKKNYVLQRALFIRATMFFQDEDWDKSIEDFKLLAELFSSSYLAPISLINAAIAFENSGKIDKAIEEYNTVVNNYSSVSPEIPNVYFSIGRLFEHKSDKTAALEAYNNLLDNFPDSNWTNLARSRIIYLESN